jgi:hypothetical protein
MKRREMGGNRGAHPIPPECCPQRDREEEIG